jgi:Glycosyltransferase family 87
VATRAESWAKLLAPAKKTETRANWRFVLPLFVALLLFAAVSLLQGGPWSSAQNDFLPFYLSGKLQLVGQLYDFGAYYALQKEIVGGVSPALVYIRLPFYSLLFVPLAKLGYLPAYGVYLAAQLLVLGLWLKAYWKTHPKLALTAAVSLPLLLAFGNGQDVILVTALAGLAWRELERRPVLAGLILSLCAIKIHLFVLVPLALARHGRWKTLLGTVAGGMVLLGLSFYAAGGDWIGEYLRVLGRPEIHPQVKLMGNLRSLAAGLGVEPAGWVLVALTAVLTAWLLWKSKSVSEALLYALAAALILNWHVYLQDFTLLLSAVPLTSGLTFRLWQGRAWAFVLSPFPYLAALPGPPWSALLPIGVLLFLGASVEPPGAIVER